LRYKYKNLEGTTNGNYDDDDEGDVTYSRS